MSRTRPAFGGQVPRGGPPPPRRRRAGTESRPGPVRQAAWPSEHEALLADSIGLALLIVLDTLRQARPVDAFVAAARGGELDRLLALLDPDVVLRADQTAMQMGAAQETRGAAEVAEFCRYARGATPALLDGAAAAVWMPGGQPRVVYRFSVSVEKITAIELIADPARLRHLDLEAPVDQRGRGRPR